MCHLVKFANTIFQDKIVSLVSRSLNPIEPVCNEMKSDEAEAEEDAASDFWNNLNFYLNQTTVSLIRLS